MFNSKVQELKHAAHGEEISAPMETWHGRDVRRGSTADIALDGCVLFLLEKVAVPIAIHRSERIIAVNSAFCTILGHENERRLLGRSIWEFVDAGDRRVFADRIKTLLSGKNSLPRVERKLIRDDGLVINVETDDVLLPMGSEPVLGLIARELSDSRQLLARMLEMERMITLGTLVAGVAHEINNPLTYVKGNLGLLAAELGLSDALKEKPRFVEYGARHLSEKGGLQGSLESADMLHAALQGVDQIANIVRDISMLSGRDREPLDTIDVHDVLNSAMSIMAGQIMARAKIEADYDRSLVVKAHKTKLCEVVINLLANAAQAIPEGKPAEHCVRLNARNHADWVVIEVKDTGCGIPEELLDCIFEPFFTTKPIGRGTGLGLSVSRQIVEAYDGSIEVQSAYGHGTTFRVKLPAARANPLPPESRHERFPFRNM